MKMNVKMCTRQTFPLDLVYIPSDNLQSIPYLCCIWISFLQRRRRRRRRRRERHGDDVCVVYAFVQIFSWFSFRILFTRTVFRDAIGKKKAHFVARLAVVFLWIISKTLISIQRIRFLVACCHHNQYQQPLLMPAPPPSPTVLLLFSYCWWCCCLFVACSHS